jgi:hypothetical protein
MVKERDRILCLKWFDAKQCADKSTCGGKTCFVTPEKVGVSRKRNRDNEKKIPAYAGMT